MVFKMTSNSFAETRKVQLKICIELSEDFWKVVSQRGRHVVYAHVRLISTVCYISSQLHGAQLLQLFSIIKFRATTDD